MSVTLLPNGGAAVPSVVAPSPPAYRDHLLQGATGLVCLLFWLLWAHQSAKPLHLDDVDHYGIAKAIAATGKPLYYRGEDATQMSGALHPPLHDHLLAAWFVVFGDGVVQARSFAACSVLLHGFTVLLLASLLLPAATVVRVTPWFAAVFLLNPYTLQMASMVDIDSSIYGPLLMLLLWSVLRLRWRRGELRADRPRSMTSPSSRSSSP